jgi:hypothetical protein
MFFRSGHRTAGDRDFCSFNITQQRIYVDLDYHPQTNDPFSLIPGTRRKRYALIKGTQKDMVKLSRLR